jgi:iron uptake system component EfeO
VPEAPTPDDGVRRWHPSRRQVLITLVALVVVGAVLIAIWPGGPSQQTAAPNTIMVSRSNCGQGWTQPAGGAQTLVLTNADSNNAEADVVEVGGPNDGKVYGEVDGLGANTSQPVQVTLGPGTYAIRCLIEDTDPIMGPAVRIGGNATANAAAVPVSNSDLLGPLKTYQAYLATGVAELATKTDTLDTAVKAGNLALARTDWLPAHLTYETLGAAYSAFGDFDGQINGTTAGLPGGVDDPSFTGFRRVEYGLWHGESAASLATVTDQLDGFVHGLRAALPKIEPQTVDLGLRAHEIMENTLQFELTGRTDEGSGTNLATADANLAGDREVLGVLRPLLATRYPRLSDVDTWSQRFQALVEAQRAPNGTWTPVSQLTPATRERLDGTLSQLVELLAPVAAIAEPRRVS